MTNTNEALAVSAVRAIKSQEFAAMSRETNAFSYEIEVTMSDGRKVRVIASNDGGGGCNRYETIGEFPNSALGCYAMETMLDAFALTHPARKVVEKEWGCTFADDEPEVFGYIFPLIAAQA